MSGKMKKEGKKAMDTLNAIKELIASNMTAMPSGRARYNYEGIAPKMPGLLKLAIESGEVKNQTDLIEKLGQNNVTFAKMMGNAPAKKKGATAAINLDPRILASDIAEKYSSVDIKAALAAVNSSAFELLNELMEREVPSDNMKIALKYAMRFSQLDELDQRQEQELT